MNSFKRATRHKIKGRIAIDGPSGSGKTFTAMRLATSLGKKIAVINTESGAVQKYLGLKPDGVEWEFDICELETFSPSEYTNLIVEAGKHEYDVIVIDSLSHAWEGIGGALEMVSNATTRNKFTAWKNVTPLHNRMISAILRSPCHIIATMRSKTEYVMETDGSGKSVPRKVGMAPVQRSGMEYEFDLYCSMDWDHVMRVSKSRCPDIDGLIAVKPSSRDFQKFADWLNDGSEPPEGFYSTSEEDFAKFKAAESKSIESDNNKTAIEKLKEKQALKEKIDLIKGASQDKPQDSESKPRASVKEPCSEIQQKQIKEQIGVLKQIGVKDIADRVKAKLAEKDLKLADLTIDEADLMLSHLKKKETIESFEKMFLEGCVPF